VRSLKKFSRYSPVMRSRLVTAVFPLTDQVTVMLLLNSSLIRRGSFGQFLDTTPFRHPPPRSFRRTSRLGTYGGDPAQGFGRGSRARDSRLTRTCHRSTADGQPVVTARSPSLRIEERRPRTALPSIQPWK
jgi:hypothetical protein